MTARTANATTHDPRRSFMVNGAAWQREQNRKEPDVTLAQSIIAGVVIAAFSLGVLLIAVGVS